MTRCAFTAWRPCPLLNSSNLRPHDSASGRTALVVGHAIAIGIFLTPAELIGAMASPVLTFALWVACGGLILAGAFLARRIHSPIAAEPEPVRLFQEGWGEGIAFLYGWRSLLVDGSGCNGGPGHRLVREYVVLLLWPAVTGKNSGLGHRSHLDLSDREHG